MELINLIESIPHLRVLAEADDLVGLLAAFNEQNVIKKNEELQTSRTIVIKYGTEFTATVLGGLKAASASNPLLDGIYIAVNSSGLNFSDPITQGMIDTLTLSGVWSEENATKLKKMGIWQESLATEALQRDAIEEEVTDALNQFKAKQVALNFDKKIVTLSFTRREDTTFNFFLRTTEAAVHENQVVRGAESTTIASNSNINSLSVNKKTLIEEVSAAIEKYLEANG